MSLETWTAFLLASVVLLAIPGPTILLVIGQSLGAGWRNAVLPAAADAALYAALAGRLSGAVTRPAVRRGLNRLGGAMLTGAGVATAAAMRRA